MTERSQELIPRLVRNLPPVHPVRFAPLLVACLLTHFALAGAGLIFAGIRGDLAERVAEPFFLALISTLAVAAAVCAATAIRLATPGRYVARQRRGLLVAVPIVLATLILAVSPWDGEWVGWSKVIGGCWPCMAVTAASAAVPWIATVMLVSRLAPLREVRVGLFAGLSAFLLGALVTELHCANGDSYHLALGHYLPISIFAGLTTYTAAVMLRYRMRSRAS